VRVESEEIGIQKGASPSVPLLPKVVAAHVATCKVQREDALH